MRSRAAVLFDLDGVIVDSRPHHLSAWERWAREHGIDAPSGYFHRTFGLRNDAIIGGLLPDIEPAELRRHAEAKESLFRARARGDLQALPGVRELLDFLEEQDIPSAIVTSTPRANLDIILETLRLSGRFGALVAEEDAAHGKPDPEGFLVAAERLGVPPERCVVIEDAPAGLQAAKAAGMRAIGVTTTRPAADLGDADLVVESLAEEVVRTFILGER
ncbi:MAG TPA: HAD family phosphatase [Dehalococcoidia bacterium]|nr:HAD family phosphatase [Dehalococcoidia bacterium]